MKNLILIPLILLSVELFAQTFTTVESIEELPRTYLRAGFQDSSLLFLNDTMIWTCHHKDNPATYYYPISKSHFNIIDTCICHAERYIKVKRSVYSETGYRLESKQEYARLARVSQDMFEYTESDKNGTRILTDTLIFDYNSILRTDSVYSEDIHSGKMKLEVYKYFDVKRK